jgi:hypothetical protein
MDKCRKCLKLWSEYQIAAAQLRDMAQYAPGLTSMAERQRQSVVLRMGQHVEKDHRDSVPVLDLGPGSGRTPIDRMNSILR